jgi:O-antigen/teichoic acid export membrane protein
MIARLTRLMLAAGTVAVFALVVAAGPVVQVVYGDRFAESASALRWLAPGIVALLLQGPFVDYLLVEGQIRAVTVVTVVSLLLNVTLDVLLLRSHTFTAAAAVASASYTLSLLLCGVLFSRRTSTSWRTLAVPRMADVRALGRLGGRTASAGDS